MKILLAYKDTGHQIGEPLATIPRIIESDTIVRVEEYIHGVDLKNSIQQYAAPNRLANGYTNGAAENGVVLLVIEGTDSDSIWEVMHELIIRVSGSKSEQNLLARKLKWRR